MPTRSELRTRLRHRRNSLGEPAQRLAAEALWRQLRRHPLWWRARRIALYWPADGEIGTWPILAGALARARQVYLPALDPLGRRRLQFRRLHAGAPLAPNRYRIPEPARTAATAPLWSLDAVCVPLVGFTEAGHRLGMGGGWYDATLATLRRCPRLRRPVLVGLAHAFQSVQELEMTPRDVALDWVLTPEGWRRGLGPLA